MASTRISSKGQIVPPKEIRERRPWTAGTQLEVEDRPDGVLLRVRPADRPKTWRDLVGMLKSDGPAPSVEEMNAAIATEVMRRHARGR